MRDVSYFSSFKRPYCFYRDDLFVKMWKDILFRSLKDAIGFTSIWKFQNVIF